MSGHVIIMSKRTQLVALVAIVTGALVALICFVVTVEGAYDRGRQAGYEAGHTDGRRQAERQICMISGEVPERCWSVDPALPQCEHEDGTPEGCLRLDIDGTTYWEVSD